jgi:hypothetical protein
MSVELRQLLWRWSVIRGRRLNYAEVGLTYADGEPPSP